MNKKVYIIFRKKCKDTDITFETQEALEGVRHIQK